MRIIEGMCGVLRRAPKGDEENMIADRSRRRDHGPGQPLTNDPGTVRMTCACIVNRSAEKASSGLCGPTGGKCPPSGYRRRCCPDRHRSGVIRARPGPNGSCATVGAAPRSGQPKRSCGPESTRKC